MTLFPAELRRRPVAVHSVQTPQSVAVVRAADPHPPRYVRQHLLVHHPQAQGDAQVLHLFLPDDPRPRRHARALCRPVTAVDRRTDSARHTGHIRLAVQTDERHRLHRQ